MIPQSCPIHSWRGAPSYASILLRSVSSTDESHLFLEPLHILGAGSIGLFLAASIRSTFPSYPVQLLLRDHHESRLERQGRKRYISVCLQQQRGHRLVHLPAQLISEQPNKPISNLILTTKTFQAAKALKSVLHRIHNDKSRILVLCNGALGVRDELKSALQEADKARVRIDMGSITHGVYQEAFEDEDDELYSIVHAGVGKIFVTDESLARLCDRAGLNCNAISEAEMERTLWYKLAANCVINPLTAIHQCTNGELLNITNFESTMSSILSEVSAVAREVAQDTFETKSLKAFVDQVISDTMENKSSMLQDVLTHRKTEIDYLNGYVVSAGRKHGIECPVNVEHHGKIQELESSYKID